jgi:ADP-heptose:LPS heptosyltransferase
MGSVLVVRSGAYGDHVCITNVIRAFDEQGWDVSLCYNQKGAQVHVRNPRIKNRVFWEPNNPEFIAELREDHEAFDRRVEELGQGYDKVVNLQNTLENALVENRIREGYYWPLYMRQDKNAHTNYYDQGMLCAGLEPDGRSGELWFSNEEHAIVAKSLEKVQDRFIVLWCWRGSMYQKATYGFAERVIRRFCDETPNALVMTIGDKDCKQFEFDHPQVVHRSGVYPFRQAALLTKYVDMVVTPETGLGLAAGTYGTTKVMLLTSSSLTNVVANDENDFSLQSEAWCSPCFRAIYDTECCEHLEGKAPDGMPLPICVAFDEDRLLSRLTEAREHAVHHGRKQHDPSDERPVYV